MVEILHGLARGAFAKIVETRNDDEAATGAVEDEAEVGEIGVRNVLDFGKRASFPDTDHRAPSVGFAIKRFDGVRGLRLGEREIDRGENAARNGKEMRREDELRFGQAGVVENFGCMAMRKKIVQQSRPWEKAPTYIKAQGRKNAESGTAKAAGRSRRQATPANT